VIICHFWQAWHGSLTRAFYSGKKEGCFGLDKASSLIETFAFAFSHSMGIITAPRPFFPFQFCTSIPTPKSLHQILPIISLLHTAEQPLHDRGEVRQRQFHAARKANWYFLFPCTNTYARNPLYFVLDIGRRILFSPIATQRELE
jgi:hypothetical protein